MYLKKVVNSIKGSTGLFFFFKKKKKFCFVELETTGKPVNNKMPTYKGRRYVLIRIITGLAFLMILQIEDYTKYSRAFGHLICNNEKYA